MPLSGALPSASRIGLIRGGLLFLAAYNLFSPNRTWSCPPDYTVDNSGLASISDGSGGVTHIVHAINSTNACNGASSGKALKGFSGSHYEAKP